MILRKIYCIKFSCYYNYCQKGSACKIELAIYKGTASPYTVLLYTIIECINAVRYLTFIFVKLSAKWSYRTASASSTTSFLESRRQIRIP